MGSYLFGKNGGGFSMEFIGDMHDSIIQTGLNRGELKLGAHGTSSYRPGDGVK